MIAICGLKCSVFFSYLKVCVKGVCIMHFCMKTELQIHIIYSWNYFVIHKYYLLIYSLIYYCISGCCNLMVQKRVLRLNLNGGKSQGILSLWFALSKCPRNWSPPLTVTLISLKLIISGDVFEQWVYYRHPTLQKLISGGIFSRF